MTKTFKYLRPEDIRKLKNFEFEPRYLVEGYLAGRHITRQQGFSTEFRDYRGYAPGDDVSSIDWRLYGRTDRHYVKTYEQESNSVSYLFLDCSASMGFGSKVTKLEYASFFSAALCYLMTRKNNQVSLHLYDKEIRHHSPLGNSFKHLRNLMTMLEDNKPGETTNTSEALRRGYPLLKKRGVVIVISDFMEDPKALFESLNMYIHRGFQVILYHLLDREELELTNHGLKRYVDVETGKRLNVHPAEIQKIYRDHVRDHIQTMREGARLKKIGYFQHCTDTNYYSLFDDLLK